MAILPSIRKLYIEDYASQKSWISPFLIVLNTFMTAVVSALDKSLNISDNTTGDIKSVTLYSVPTLQSRVSIAWKKSMAPVAVIVGNVKPKNDSPLTVAVFVEWRMAIGNQLQITNIVGITPTQDNPVTLTLLCIAG